MAQRQPVWIRPAAELSSPDSGQPQSHLVLPSCRSEPMGEALERPWVAGGKGKLEGAGPGFLEVMVSNRGCQGCSFWVTQLSALVCIIAVLEWAVL